MKAILNKQSFFIVSAVLFRLILDLAYVTFINPIFSYAGYELDFTFVSYILSIMIYCCAVVITPYIFRKVSDYFLCSFLLAVLAPLSSLLGLTGWPLLSLFVTLFSFVFIRIIVSPGILTFPTIPSLRQGNNIAKFISVVSVVMLVMWYFYSGAWRYFNLDFSKVYEYREDSASVANVGVLAYLNNWVYQIFSIFIIAWLLVKKNIFWVVVAILVQVFFYGVTGHKSLFFYPILVLVIWFYFRRYSALSILSLSFSIVITVNLLLYYFFDHYYSGSMFIRRVFYVPAFLTFKYFEFFSDNSFILWSNSVLSSIVQYPYEEPLGLLIGKFEGSGAWANNGYVASGFAHFGFWGVTIYTVIFAFVLKLVDSISYGKLAPWFALSLTIVPLRAALISSDLLTTLLTHGLIVSIFMLYLSSNKRGV